MARTRNNKFIGAAAHAQKMDDMRTIEWQNALARKASEEKECRRERKIMHACYNVFGDIFVNWYSSPAVPEHGCARDRIALIRAWAKEQVCNARTMTAQAEEDADIIHELIKAAEYAELPADYDATDPHAVVESKRIDRELSDQWAFLPEIEL